MNLFNNYWYFKSAIPSKICDDIIKYGLSQKETMGKVGGFENENPTIEQIKNAKRKRNSDVAWLADPWIYREIHPYVHKANKNAGWNFQWDFSEPCQFTKYKLNQYYDWHCDSQTEIYSDHKDTDRYGKIRKLSMTCQLTDGSEYEGGELEFDFKDYAPHMRDEDKHLIKVKEILPKGSIVVFPSHAWHRVKPVTKGVRYSLVAWHLGYPFK